jgi:microcystin-dependent protein
MDPILGTIIIFAGNFAPKGWALCDGSILAISSNSALFSLLGTTYGGNGTTTFALPDLRGRAPISAGTGPGLRTISLGEMAGSQTTVITPANLPPAPVTIRASNGEGTSPEPANNVMAISTAEDNIYAAVSAANTAMAVGMIAGSNVPVNNMSPYLGINYIIATSGIYPSRP